MKQRVNVITLGVGDLGRSRRIYEALGFGYSSVIVDPDGYPWEIAHNPRWTITEDGGVRLAGER